jgi:TolB-like protein/DNA-binding winged helix-turn-helix (wHTH) protein
MPVREVIFYDFDDFRLDVKKQELLKNDIPVALTHKAFQILLILVQNFGQTVGKENIYNELWADSFVEDANLTQHIYVLRKTLGPKPDGEPYIETVPRLGYRFSAEVKSVYSSVIVPLTPTQNVSSPIRKPVGGAFPAEMPEPYLRLAENPAPQTEDEKSVEPVIVKPEPISHKNRNILVAVLSAVAIAMILFAIFKNRPPASLPNAQPIKSIAVLPFKTIGDESHKEQLGLGMADAIITRLSKLTQIPVRPTSSVFRYTDAPPESSVAAGQAMGVETVLEGTVQRDENRVRVTAQLINVADGKPLWADSMDEDYVNIFSVQDSIAAKIVSALQVNLTPQQQQLLAQQPTNNKDAYQAYQLGVYFANQRTKDSLEKGISYFEKAIELDPNYATAYALLADTYNMLAYYGFADPQEAALKARPAAEKALALNDSLAEAYIALSWLEGFKPNSRETAKRLLERAIELSPYNSTARVRYGWLLLRDDPNAAEYQMRLAQQYDPLSGISNGALGDMLVVQGKSDEAIKYCEKSAELMPDSVTAQTWLADAYFLSGRHDDAIIQIKKAINVAEGFEKLSTTGSLGFYYAKMGQTDEAEKIYEQLRSVEKKYPSVLNDLALIAYALDRPDEGFEYFQKSYEKRLAQVPINRRNPLWNDVYTDQRVINLIDESQKKPTP